MDELDRRIVLRKMLGGVAAVGLGTGLLTQAAKALPLAPEDALVAKTDDPERPLHMVVARPPPRPRPPPPRRRWHRRRRWTCWWHRGRRRCGWRW
ncbi:hypothetical protein DXU07_36100 [Bradyrhizobium elkanii]|nr:hypothetical protein [Bradyrhizobium elkanii]NWL70973.1 hypothetical protein [Bradyrhizobium elkanii]QOZ21889.1 hypothetical protein XI02_26800 [Bradyrhizobium sp. CCBAU 21365]RYM20306.1 hypothetical protein EWH13_31015 [Bradyrhizobium elkanii]